MIRHVAVHGFYTAPFSALQQIHSALVACGFESVTVEFYSTAFLNIQMVYLQCYYFGFYVVGAT